MHRSKMSLLKLPSGNQKETKSLRWIFQMGVFNCLRMGEWWVLAQITVPWGVVSGAAECDGETIHCPHLRMNPDSVYNSIMDRHK